MTIAELEHALRREPANRELQLVYADALIERGDPRGELIVIAGDCTTRDQRVRERELRLAVQRELVATATIHLGWDRGCVTRLAFDARDDAAIDRLAALLARPELACLQALDLRLGWPDDATRLLAALPELLAGRGVRWLGLGRRDATVANVAALCETLALTGLAVYGAVELAEVLALPLVDLELDDTELARDRLFAARDLERLVLHGATAFERLGPVLDGDALPALRHLGVMRGTDELNTTLCERVARSPRFARLASIGMSFQRGANTNLWLIEHAAEVAHLALFAAPSYDSWIEAWHDLGHLLESLGRHDEALAELDALVAIADTAAHHADLGHVLLALKRHDEALVASDRAIALDATNQRAWSARACALQELGRMADAVAAWDGGQAAGLADLHAWQNRAYALIRLERYAEALVALDASLALDPANAWAKSQRADIAARNKPSLRTRALGWLKRSRDP